MRSPEVHYILLEGLSAEHKMGLLGFFKMIWSSRKFKVLPLDGRWQISDFDNYMSGNPHDLETMRKVFGKVPKAAPLPTENEEERQ